VHAVRKVVTNGKVSPALHDVEGSGFVRDDWMEAPEPDRIGVVDKLTCAKRLYATVPGGPLTGPDGLPFIGHGQRSL
jgi:hypothetical protein